MFVLWKQLNNGFPGDSILKPSLAARRSDMFPLELYLPFMSAYYMMVDVMSRGKVTLFKNSFAAISLGVNVVRGNRQGGGLCVSAAPLLLMPILLRLVIILFFLKRGNLVHEHIDGLLLLFHCFLLLLDNFG